MRRCYLLFIILFAFAFALGLGCSGTSSNTDQSNGEIPTAGTTDANAALAEGKRLLDENQIDAAIVSLERAVELDPDLAEAHFQLGIAYDLLDMQREQSGEFVESNTDDKKKPRSEKAFERAVVAYKKWLTANPKDDVAHFNLGRTYAKLNKDEEAVDSFEQAVKLKPDDTEYLTELGAAQIKLARYHEAIKSLEKAIELDQTNSRAIEMLEDAKAGRQRVTYKDNRNTNANRAVNSNTSTSNSNSGTNSNGSTRPPVNTPPIIVPPRPASTPKDQPRGRVSNNESRTRKTN